MEFDHPCFLFNLFRWYFNLTNKHEYLEFFFAVKHSKAFQIPYTPNSYQYHVIKFGIAGRDKIKSNAFQFKNKALLLSEVEQSSIICNELVLSKH